MTRMIIMKTPVKRCALQAVAMVSGAPIFTRTSRYEACDDGNDVDTDAVAMHARSHRGDGVVRTDIDPNNVDYEVCDDGNFSNAGLASTAVWPRIAAMGLSGPMLKNATMTTTATPASMHVSSPAAGTACFEMTSR